MHLIISKDKEEIRRALASLLKHKEGALVSFYPENFSTQTFLQEVETLPFLSQHKKVVVHEIEQLDEEAKEAICHFIEHPNRWISLYLTALSLSAQSKLAKLMEKRGKVRRFREEKPWEKEKRLAEWLVHEAKGEGVKLSLQAATALAKGVDHQMLNSEIEKLICYVGEKKEITLDAIRAVSIPIHHETLWQLGDAIFARQTASALTIGKILLQEGMTIFPLLANLRSQFQTGIEIVQDRAPPYLKGRLLEKKQGILKNYGMQRLQQGLLLLFETEIQAKSSTIEPSLLLEILLAKLTHDTLSTPKSFRTC